MAVEAQACGGGSSIAAKAFLFVVVFEHISSLFCIKFDSVVEPGEPYSLSTILLSSIISLLPTSLSS